MKGFDFLIPKMDNRIVKKFGGTSVGSIEKITALADRIAKDVSQGQRPVVVISAMSGWTDNLTAMARAVHPSAKGEAYDMLLSSGEQVSTALLSLALEKKAVPSQPLLGHQAGIKTSDMFSTACIQSIETQTLEEILDQGLVPVVAGFQGVTKDHRITTLGRGGSDLTALALSAALNIPVCEIYTDVPGVMTGDPRLIPQAKKQKRLGFSEMMEMSFLGAKVLQLRAVELARKYNIKIHVRSSFSKDEGTWITEKKEADMEGFVVSAVAHDTNTEVVRIEDPPQGPGFVSDLFGELGRAAVFVDIISQNELEGRGGLAFSLPKTDSKKAHAILKTLVPEKSIQRARDVAKISVVGAGMAGQPGVAGRFFSVLKKTAGKLYLVSTSEIKISAVIPACDLQKTAKALHAEFGLSL